MAIFVALNIFFTPFRIDFFFIEQNMTASWSKIFFCLNLEERANLFYPKLYPISKLSGPLLIQKSIHQRGFFFNLMQLQGYQCICKCRILIILIFTFFLFVFFILWESSMNSKFRIRLCLSPSLKQ